LNIFVNIIIVRSKVALAKNGKVYMDRSRQIKLLNQLREQINSQVEWLYQIGHENSGKSFIQFAISNNRIVLCPS